MASRSEAGRGTDVRGSRDGGTHARWIFAGAILVTLAWLVGLILLAYWLISAVF